MKRIFLFSLILLTYFGMAQNFNYEQKWKEVQALSVEGYSKSLLPKIEEIYSHAKRENNTSEIIKALVYQERIVSEVQEDPENDPYKQMIQKLEAEIPSFKGVTMPVMQSLLAKVYKGYYDNVRWKRQNITDTEVQSTDVSTWTPQQLLDKSISLYKESVWNKEIIRKEQTRNWISILTQKEDLNLNPTLYDVLVNRYINALREYKGDSESTAENKQTIENLTQELLSFHKNDTDKSAYLSIKLQEITNSENIQEAKTEKIIQLAQTYSDEPFAAYLYYVAAQNVQNEDKVKAFSICNKVSFSKDNPWSVNCNSFKESLQRQELSATIDNIVLPGENIPVTLRATNLDKVYYRIYEVNPVTASAITEKNSKLLQSSIFGTDKKQIKSGNFSLKHFDDYSSHSTIVRLEGLPMGNYLIEFANTPEFKAPKSKESSLTGSVYFTVDDWTIVSLAEKSSYQLVNRKTGEVIGNKQIQLFKRLDYSSKNPRVLSGPTLVTTDKNGIFSVTDSKNSRYYFYLYNPVSQSYQQLYSGYYRYGNNTERENRMASFFTDRTIYRPGQKVYFKAVLYTKNKEKATLVKNQKTEISLYNTNGKKVSSLSVTSNEYGSIFGEFILPQDGLTGSYSLRSDWAGSAYFSVEEYKRPKFQVTMDQLEGEYILEKEVVSKGKSVSFAGAPISEAKVVYRVERQEIFLYTRWYFPPQYSSPETIAQGETLTDGEGKFEIPFIAKAKDPKKEKEYRTYTYTVYADVTDINGETHSTQTAITIGDLPKKLTLNIPEKATQKELTQLSVSSTNLNGVKEPSKGKITMSRLVSPDKIILPSKVNSVPDYQLYDEKEFTQYFPYLPYTKEEQDPKFWKKEKPVVYDFDTQKSDTVKIKPVLKKGYYWVEAYTLYGKDSIKTQKIIEILDDQALKSTDNLFYTVSTGKTSYKVGETIDINFFSDLKSATAILHIESKNQWIEHKEIPIKNGKGTYSLPAKQEYLQDGLFISTYLVKENGYIQNNFQVTITDKPRDLKIATKVFRDKITPGAKETWELTIIGKDKDKVTAEVLAAMYDASLDEFSPNSYSFAPWAYYAYGSLYYQLRILENGPNSLNAQPYSVNLSYKTPVFTDLNDFQIYGRYGYHTDRFYMATAAMPSAVTEEKVQYSKKERNRQQEDVSLSMGAVNNIAADEMMELSAEAPKPAAPAAGMKQKTDSGSKDDLSTVQARTNLQETAFFYPNLYTDENGNVKITFTSPEALTKWKLLILAHTQELESGTAQYYTQTQKELMVVPNVPRFLREGDQITLSTKINNLSPKNLEGNAQLFLLDAFTNLPIDTGFNNNSPVQSFRMEAGKNAEVNWTIKVPANVQAVTWRIVAQAGDFSDGEESILPVLTNRMLVTETLPISIKENQTKEYRFDKLIDQKSGSLQNFNLSLEMTTNPTWLAVLSLPYLREYPYECSEQLFSRLYGNILSTYVLNSSPKIKKVFDDWNSKGLNVSNLEKNEELKNILLEETPWVRQAQNETEQRKRIALFFDLNKMSQENTQAQNKLLKRQNSNGGFSWFDGGYSSQYITERIILGFGQLKTMLGKESSEYLNPNLNGLIKKAIAYTDEQTIKYIKEQKKQKSKVDGKSLMHYYYVRSYWKDQYKLPAEISAYLGDINKDIPSYFKTYDLQNKAMAAVVLNRYGYKQSAQSIVRNMKETSVEADEMGMYWKDNKPGWFWYQTPVESQVRAIEAFAEVTPEDVPAVEEMKVWLLKNRQTNSWNSTKATTDAVYALMSFGKDWSNAEEGVKVWTGNTQFFPSQNETAEQASGYIKQSWKGAEITPDKGSIKVEKTSPGVAWGGMYWQYFEDLDKITQADTNIKMQKQLFLKVNTEKGQQLQEITNTKAIKVGDLVTVKLVIKVDRDMEYIHIKDMRASGFEPVNVLSSYKFQNGAGYYESTRDAATNFFFERLRKGTYVFEYDVRANNKGEFSNGITQLQNMYAPEMSAHSEGVKVLIK